MILLDLDGVVIDFCTAAYAAHGRTCAVNEPAKYDFFEDWGLSPDEFWQPIDEAGPEWWANLPLYPWAHELVALLCDRSAVEGMEFLIATTPSRHANSTAGKVTAIQKFCGEQFRGYAITPRKWLFGAPGRVLIDDNEDNCRKFEERGGRAFLFPQPWNGGGHIKDKVEAVRQWI